MEDAFFSISRLIKCLQTEMLKRFDKQNAEVISDRMKRTMGLKE